MMKKLSIAIAAATCLATPALAEGPPRPEEARIAFVNFGGIRDFRADGEEVVYLQDRRRNWYRAEVIGPCRGLTWAHAIGVDTRGSPSFDRFSTLIVDGERCQLTSLVHSDKPPKKAKKPKRHG